MAKKGKKNKNEKQITKIVADKTFGMKNKKKSKKVQNLIKNIANTDGGGYEKMRNKLYEEKKRKKELEKEKKFLGSVLAN